MIYNADFVAYNVATFSVPVINQSTWISGRRNSDDDIYVWPNGDRVSHGLIGNSGPGTCLQINVSDFKLHALRCTHPAGPQCEAGKHYSYVTWGCNHRLAHQGRSQAKITCTRDINSLWSCDALWRQRFGSTLVQVMACCLTVPKHCLKEMLKN